MKRSTLFSALVFLISNLVSTHAFASANPNHQAPSRLAATRIMHHDKKVKSSKKESAQGVGAVLAVSYTPNRSRPKKNKPHTTKRQKERSYSNPEYNHNPY